MRRSRRVPDGQIRVRLTPQASYFSPHGGVISSLAEIAYGAACNSHGGAAVALSMSISFLTAAPAGSRLIAVAREIPQGRRAGFYQVSVTSEEGRW